jgi:uncharacterized protein (DUF934 family)
MSMILRLDRERGPYVEGEPNAPKPAEPAVEEPVVVEGRGDARLASYKRKPPSEKPAGPDWTALGYVTMPEWLSDHPPQGHVALALEPTDDPHHLADKLDGVARIAIYFPKFTDGRGYSLAAILRTRLGWTGEIRAVGDVLRDQLFYMARCGFDAMELRDDQDPDACVAAVADFSDVYQTAADGRPPLFLRRAAP